MKSLLPALAGMLLLSACAGPQYAVNSAPTITVPDATVQTLGARTVLPDSVVLSVPVGFALAARLEHDTQVQIIGRDYAFASAETLPVATLWGQAADALPDGATIFCGRGNTDLAKGLLNASTLGITSVLNRTGAVTQVCFIDSDKDLSAEQAILVGVKRAEDAAPVTITPLRYALAAGVPMSGESEMRIIYRGKTGLVGGHVSFDLVVMEQGTALYFQNVRSTADLDKLPADVTIMGATFTVQSYDPVTGAAVIDVKQGIPGVGYGVQMTTTTQYIPIYMPR